jgi:hypothetical protein
MINTLYHPYFEPKESFLRAMLLFYGTVYSIVPEEAEYAPTSGISALREKVEEAFVPLSPDEKDLAYDWDNYQALIDVLRELATQEEEGGREEETEGQVLTRVDWSQDVPSLDLGRSVKVHTDKMADVLADDLVYFGLAEQTDDSAWLRVDRRAADLVLSMLADRMSKNRPTKVYNTSSDQEPSFAVAAKSALHHSEQWVAKATLASAILTTAIPADLAELPLDRYLEIRKRYEDKQEAFQLAMKEMRDLHLDCDFQKPEDFNKELERVVTKFGQEMQDLREGRFGRRVRRWTLISLGGIVTVAAAAIVNPVVAVGVSGVGYAMQTLLTSQGEPAPATYKAALQSHLVELDRTVNWNRHWLGRVFSW